MKVEDDNDADHADGAHGHVWDWKSHFGECWCKSCYQVGDAEADFDAGSHQVRFHAVGKD
tara:strand:+ start:164 stop:343 length:180 start_codon:yes stop_codon:yes gene_type:complete